MAKPLLIYDGDCDYCQYSVDYWQRLTHDKVDYQPYQKVGTDYPEITPEQYQKAIQYITPDRQISSGAKAAFLTLSNAVGHQYWLILYKYLPGFALISEFFYSLVSSHRKLFYKISIFFWGRHPLPPTYDLITWLFLRGLGILFLIAFYSFGTQALGLIGHEGIIPVKNFLAAVKSQFGNYAYWYVPNLFWINDSDLMIQCVSFVGGFFSLCLIVNIAPRLCLLIMYVCYLTLIYGGQVFMTFQWDMLLIEISIIALFLVRFRILGIWLLRWLTFRFFFVSGIVKIASGDPSWWDLTALNYHFLTQPLPTPLAWYAYYLPETILRFLTGFTLFIELIIPFFIFMPRRMRWFAAILFLGLQISILLTGNYNFFNLTAMLLVLSLLDDNHLSALRFGGQAPCKNQAWKVTKYLAGVYVGCAIIISSAQFNSRYLGYVPYFSGWLQSIIAPLQLVNSYGPFAVMTKKRYEIIVEGTDDGVNWKEYEFIYKPGELNQRPLINIPFQPRLDWQMWFAALTAPQNSPWFFGFMEQLLHNSPAVTSLLKTNPFKESPPVFVRALFYDYRYTTEAEYKKTHHWWDRTLVGIFVPPVALNNTATDA